MAISTSDVYVGVNDGWTLISTDPITLTIKPGTFHPWNVAITAGGAPSNDLVGVPMGREAHNKLEAFEANNITGEVYVRITSPVEPSTSQGAKLRFGVIKDE